MKHRLIQYNKDGANIYAIQQQLWTYYAMDDKSDLESNNQVAILEYKTLVTNYNYNIIKRQYDDIKELHIPTSIQMLNEFEAKD